MLSGSATAETAPGPEGECAGGVETILLVEDEQSVRDLITAILSQKGYDVITAASGADAQELFRRKRRSPIRCIITDLVLPDMTGDALMESLSSAWAGVPVLYISGYPENTIVLKRISGPSAFLPKPFRTTELCERLRSLVERPPQPDHSMTFR